MVSAWDSTMISFRCPTCAELITAADSKGGERVACGLCGAVTNVPGGSGEAKVVTRADRTRRLGALATIGDTRDLTVAEWREQGELLRANGDHAGAKRADAGLRKAAKSVPAPTPVRRRGDQTSHFTTGDLRSSDRDIARLVAIAALAMGLVSLAIRPLGVLGLLVSIGALAEAKRGRIAALYGLLAVAALVLNALAVYLMVQGMLTS